MVLIRQFIPDIFHSHLSLLILHRHLRLICGAYIYTVPLGTYNYTASTPVILRETVAPMHIDINSRSLRPYFMNSPIILKCATRTSSVI